MDRFFDFENEFEFKGSKIQLNKKNSIKINFKTVPIISKYQLLLVFELHNEKKFPHHLQNDLRKILTQNIQKIVLWSNEQLDPVILQNLKDFNISVISSANTEFNNFEVITNFFPLENSKDNNYLIILNRLCNLLVKRLKKIFHMVLSEIAAPTYDTDYGKDSNIGTKSIMEFEEKIIQSVIKNYFTDKKNQKIEKIAIDVGCGTGRHSFKIYHHFDKIYGIDFSQRMIEQAKQKKAEKHENISFSVVDLEHEYIHNESKLNGKIDFIIASFGMGSFIEDTAKIFRRYNEWLKPEGKIILSFYNKNSIILNMTPNWRDTSLAAHIDPDNNTLRVKLSDKIVFQIYCKPFDDEINGMLQQVFKVDKVYSYPTTIALLPNNLLKNQTARNIFSKIDAQISDYESYGNGHYVLVVATKSENSGSGEKRINKILKKFSKIEKIKHAHVVNINDVKRELNLVNEKKLLKTVILHDKKNNRYISIVLPANKRINTSVIKQLINDEDDKKEKTIKNLKLATDKEILRLGFQIGGIAPFGFNPDCQIIKFIDIDIVKNLEGNIYTGAGNNFTTLKMDISVFRKIITDYRAIEINTVS